MQERAHCLCERSLRICWTLWHRLLPSLWLPRFSYCPVLFTCLSMLALKSHIMFWVLLSCKRCSRSGVKHGSVPSFILRASRGCRVGTFPHVSYFVCSFMFSHLMEKASVSVLPRHDSKWAISSISQRKSLKQDTHEENGHKCSITRSCHPREQAPQHGP